MSVHVQQQQHHHQHHPHQPFDFSNVKRNALLSDKGLHAPQAMKTGTTIVGVIYKDGVVLGADTRATEGPIVADKNCEKIHHIAQFIHCCGAGTAADTEAVTNLVASQLELHKLATGREPRVAMAMTRLKQRLFQYQGYVSAALVLGGVDATGSYLYTVYPHGSVDKLPYATMGSGSLAAMSVFEAGYRDNLNESEAVELVSQAIQAGIFNDLGSGSNVDVMVIRKATQPGAQPSTQYTRGYVKPNERMYRRKKAYTFPKGSTEWLHDTERIWKHDIDVSTIPATENTAAGSSVAMET